MDSNIPANLAYIPANLAYGVYISQLVGSQAGVVDINHAFHLY